MLRFYAKGNLTTVLGDKDFREAIAEDKEALTVSGDFAQGLSKRPDAAKVVSVVASAFNASETDIVTRRRGRQKLNVPRQVPMYCCQQFGDMPLKAIAEYFELGHFGSVSPAVASVKKLLQEGELNKELGQIEQSFNFMK